MTGDTTISLGGPDRCLYVALEGMEPIRIRTIGVRVTRDRSYRFYRTAKGVAQLKKIEDARWIM